MEIKLNMNVNLRQGGRNAVKMSMSDFQDKLADLGAQIGTDADDEYNFIQEVCYCVPSIKKDMKVAINMENLESSYRMTSHGVPYLLVEATSDYSAWIVFMIYWDGTKFRAYIPTYGNPWNTKTKEPLGENPQEDFMFIVNQIGEKKVKKIIGDAYDDDDDVDGEDLLYDLIQNIYFDADACIHDFESRLTVK